MLVGRSNTSVSFRSGVPLKRSEAGRTALLACVAGTVALAVAAAWAVLDKDFTGSDDLIPYQIGFAARLATAVLLITGMSALHRIQKPWAGTTAQLGYVVTIASLVLFAVLFSSFWVLGWLGLHLGLTLFGAGVLRARILSTAAGWVLAVGTPVAFGAGIAVDRLLDGRGGPSAFAGTGVALIGLLWLALSEARRSDVAA